MQAHVFFALLSPKYEYPACRWLQVCVRLFWCMGTLFGFGLVLFRQGLHVGDCTCAHILWLRDREIEECVQWSRRKDKLSSGIRVLSTTKLTLKRTGFLWLHTILLGFTCSRPECLKVCSKLKWTKTLHIQQWIFLTSCQDNFCLQLFETQHPKCHTWIFK